jgi:hypothetical protein
VNVRGLLPFESGLLVNAACFDYNSCPAALHCEHYEGPDFVNFYTVNSIYVFVWRGENTFSLCGSVFVPPYLLHGAESFLRS